jgi:hypothetical protein
MCKGCAVAVHNLNGIYKRWVRNEALHRSSLNPLPPHPTILLSFPHTNQLPFLRSHPFPSDMGDQSRSTHFRTLFESALQAYKEKTGITLIEHPLAVQLQSCRSVESITAVLQDQIRASNDFGGNDRIMKSIKSIISITSTLSATAALDWVNGLVCQKALMTCSTSLTRFLFRHFHLKMRYTLESLSYLRYASHRLLYVSL